MKSVADGPNDSGILGVIEHKSWVALSCHLGISVPDGNAYVHHGGELSRKDGPRGTGLANSNHEA